MPVMDASVYIALLNAHEPAHTRSWAWLEKTRGAQESISTPTILLAEVAAAISRGVGDSAFAHRAIQQLVSSELIDLVPVTQGLAERAAYIAARYKIRGCDAVYIALADQIGDSLVTLDRQQLERGGGIITAYEP